MLCCASVTRGFCCVWSERLDAYDWLNGCGGVSKLVKSNLPRSKFPFIWGGGVKSNLSRSKFPFWRGVAKLVKSNLPRSKFSFIWGGGPQIFIYIHPYTLQTRLAALYFSRSAAKN